VTIHRGVGDGITPPIVRQYTGRDLAANVDLTRFALDQLTSVTAGLQANGIRYVRQTFSWAEMSPHLASMSGTAMMPSLSRSIVAVSALLPFSTARQRGFDPRRGEAFDALQLISPPMSGSSAQLPALR
jgi:hypothetical protein